MAFRKSLTVCFLASIVTGAYAAERVYTPAVKPGENPAAVASPRDDWYRGVQAKFDKYGNKPADIVFDGDSITNRWETTGKAVWAEQFAKRAADFGIEGDRVENVLWRLSKGQVDGINPKVVVLMIGTNNTGRDSAEQIAEGIKKTVDEYLNRCPRAHLILMSVFPRAFKPNDPARLKVVAINKSLAAIRNDRVDLVDIGPKLTQPDGVISPQMMPDAVHPTAAGYKIWADALAPYLEKYLK
ncbi:MAG: GDSL-type esterase/lipase family protein [Tepidisphaeraceae bacterium]